MKYGESCFDIIYLLFAIILGIQMLKGAKKDKVGRLMGVAVLILGIGDAFHLVPRVLNYFVDSDFTAALGFGKLVTSITMTIFYIFMFWIWQKLYDMKRSTSKTGKIIYVLAALRIILCLLPQNQWFTNEGSVTWGIIRNIPFVLIGAIIVYLYFIKKDEIKSMKSIWLLVTLSFLFYIPVAVGASVVPMLGMLMLPKTVCYMIMIWIFYKYTKKEELS
ncbi:MAG: hypothetical protein K5653_04085 [Clostridiales bacterium]|nr:hypothetical protein [Clostridiales bacterium]